jgi:hypothetical protein
VAETAQECPRIRFGTWDVADIASTRYASGHLLASQPGRCILRCTDGTQRTLDWRCATALDADPHARCPVCNVAIGMRLPGERSPFSTLRHHAPASGGESPAP